VAFLDADEGLGTVSTETGRLAADCRFRDCGHTTEPGCAVRDALEGGRLDAGRWAHFQKLSRELADAGVGAEAIADPEAAIVRTLEQGQAPLDESIELYQRGDRLKRHCEARLKAAA